MELKEGKIRKGGLNPDPKSARPNPPKPQRTKNQIVIAEGELDNVKWKSPYNKLVFYFKGLPEMIGIKIIKSRKVKIILEE